ncbi:MAG: hypothetical protein JXJ04_23460 [Spirochaetales bacterium]|nr:hypothetical protein [Spirochaetales bacterium]
MNNLLNKNKTHIFFCVFLFCISLQIFGFDIVVRYEQEELNHKSIFNFNTISSDNRTSVQYFTIYNESPDTDLTINRIELGGINENEFELVENNVTGAIVPFGSSINFGIRFTSNTKDGSLKKSIINIYNNFMTGPYQIEFYGTAKSSGVLLFKEIGTYYWKSPYNVIAVIEVMGGGQAGSVGHYTPVRYQDYYGNNKLYDNGDGGRGGSTGEYIKIDTIQLITDTVYKIVVGPGGTINEMEGSPSSFGIDTDDTYIAKGGIFPPTDKQIGGASGGGATNDYSGKGGSGGDNIEDFFSSEPAQGGARRGTEGEGHVGSDALKNTGNGGGGGSGGNSGKYDKYYHTGGAGGAGGSGYVRIQWWGFLY